MCHHQSLQRWCHPEDDGLNLNRRCRNFSREVADFGLAAECSQGLQGVVGTLPYMAPQVLFVSCNLGHFEGITLEGYSVVCLI